MPLPEGLLEQAWQLDKHDPSKPRQASLWRVISVACYALFHKLIAEVAGASGTLQERRHEADCDLGAVFRRAVTWELFERTDSAFAEWQKVHNTGEANAFLAAHLCANRWSK